MLVVARVELHEPKQTEPLTGLQLVYTLGLRLWRRDLLPLGVVWAFGVVVWCGQLLVSWVSCCLLFDLF